MSDKTRYPRSAALRVAKELCDLLRPHVATWPDNTPCLIVAGSLRRRKAEVGDVEILFIPKLGAGAKSDLFSEAKPADLTELAIGQLLSSGVLAKRPNKEGNPTWGPKNKLAVHVASGIPVDLFATTEANWFVSLVIRTGGKDTNLILTHTARKLGFTLHAYGDGVSSLTGDAKIPATSERHVFQLCGVNYLEPWERL